jgi:hypothetical protein
VRSGLASRYWSTLIGVPRTEAPTGRGRAGYSFGRRYVAALLGVSLSPRTPEPQRLATRVSRTPAPITSWRQPVVTGSPLQQLRWSAARNHSRRRTRWGLIGAAACALVITVAVVHTSTPPSVGAPPPATYGQTPHPSDTDEPTESSDTGESTATEIPPISDLAFDLRNGTAVPWCTAFEGSGSSPPEGDAVLTVQSYDDGVMYYKARLTFDGDVWRADNVVIGAPTDNDQPYELRVYAVTPDVADQLTSSHQGLPDIPGRLLAQLDVVRVNDPGYC